MKKTGRFLVHMLFLMIAAVFMAVPVAAATAEESGQVYTSTEQVDFNRKGSIAITVRDIETKELSTIGVFELFKVADLIYDANGQYRLEWTKEFEGSQLSLEGLTKDTQKPLADQLQAYIRKNNIAALRTLEVDDKGTVTYTDLSLGLYVIIMKSGFEEMMVDPFCVIVPSQDPTTGKLTYDIVGAPKGTVQHVTETKTPTPTPTTDTPTPTYPIPKTGQLWWPVPILALAGLFFLAVGWKKKRDVKG